MNIMERLIYRLLRVAADKMESKPRIIDRRETVCIWCRAVTSEGEPHEENCGL